MFNKYHVLLTWLVEVFILDLYKRWALPRKKLTRLGHETSYLDYSIPSFKVPGVFGALAPREVCFWHQNYQKEFFAGVFWVFSMSIPKFHDDWIFMT
eukprot:sb/3478962/